MIKFPFKLIEREFFMFTDKEIADFCRKYATYILEDQFDSLYQMMTDSARAEYSCNENYLKELNDQMIKEMLLDKKTLHISKNKIDSDELGISIMYKDGLVANCAVVIEGTPWKAKSDDSGELIMDDEMYFIPDIMHDDRTSYYSIMLNLKIENTCLLVNEIYIE